MPTENYKFPKITVGSSVYFVGETASAPESLLATGTVDLFAKKLMTALALSAELEEDAVLPIVPVNTMAGDKFGYIGEHPIN
jgi:HK97 family phage major capsid protein